MYWGLKYLRDFSCIKALCARSLACQKSVTLTLQRSLKVSLVGGDLRRRSGWGRLYIKHRSRILANQFLLLWLALVRSFVAILWRMFPCRWQIIPNSVSCFRWGRASPGSRPARKNTTGSGVLGCSFSRLSVVSFTCLARISISALARRREATPE